MPLLGYSKWERFSNAIEYAKTSCLKSGYNTNDHFPGVGKMVQIGSKTKRKLLDYRLSRYACYLIVQNGDSRKEAKPTLTFKQGNKNYLKKNTMN